MSRLAATLGLTLLVVVGSAAPAEAHAELIDSSPRAGAGLARAPSEVVIRFSERVNVDLSEIRVLDDDGRDSGLGPTVAVDGDRAALRREVDLLSPGRYTVHWRSASPFDGHALTGSYAFGVGTSVDGAAVVRTGPVASQGWLGLVGRLGAVAGLVVWIGGAIGARVALRLGVPNRRARRIRVVALAAVIGGTLIAAVSTAVSGAGLAELADVFLSSQSGQRRLAVVALAGFALLVRRVSLVDLALAGPAVLAAVASGHAGSAPVPWLAAAVFAVHLSAVGVWLYALIFAATNRGAVRLTLRAFGPAAIGAAALVRTSTHRSTSSLRPDRCLAMPSDNGRMPSSAHDCDMLSHVEAGPDALRIRRLIGIYNAAGSLRGEASYLISKLLHRDSCALCDLTHRGIRRRTDFDDAAQQLPVPIELLHLEARSADVIAASQGCAPCVLAETEAGLVMLLGPEGLQACDGSPWALVDALCLSARQESLCWLNDGES